jgi:hypothetical protein
MGRKIIQNSEKESRWKFTKLTSEYFKDHKEEFETISLSDDFEFLSINEDSNFFANTYFTPLKNTPFNKFKIKTNLKSMPLYIFVSDTWFYGPTEGFDFIFFWVSRKNNFNPKDCIAAFYMDIDVDHEISLINDQPNENWQDFVYAVNSSINKTIEVVDYINSPKTTIHKEKPRPLNVLAKPQKSNSNDVIYINKREYTYDEPSDNEKRDYERHVKECSVRGHWRRYRDKEGNVKKKVWIEPHKRHFDDGTEENEKTYKI